MIRFSLKCPQGHVFESWFKSSAAFASLRDGGLITCPDCGEITRDKALMAPDVRPGRAVGGAPADVDDEAVHALAEPLSQADSALHELIQKVKENSEYVGDSFAKEARAIHDGEAPERSIYGQASRKEARELVEDGIPVAPLPMAPPRKVN